MLATKDIKVYTFYPNEINVSYPKDSEVRVDFKEIKNRIYSVAHIFYKDDELVRFTTNAWSLYTAVIPKGSEYSQTKHGIYTSSKLDFKLHIYGDPKIDEKNNP